ncbi:hypothetical protein [Consotaella aegiceratis]|uniref:hypothetical protein n=1 Tax=Consotaella aegiceratis TaxID=3097961 RepID=UPI002F403887
MKKKSGINRDRAGSWRGAFTGYPEYRYGSPRPVTLPKIFRGNAREHVLDVVVDEMRDWRLTPFETEGEMTHSLRSNLCLVGHGYARSDQEARSIVGEALLHLGAERPTWEQGQPGYIDPRENCVQCGKPLDPIGNGKGYRFCSEVCAKAAVERRDFERRDERDRLYAAAQRVIKKTKTRPRTCAWCGEAFHPVREASKQECCSFSCSAALKRARNPPPVFTVECTFCGNEFDTVQPKAMFCCKACTLAQRRLDRGIVPQFVTVRVFDRYFSRDRETAPREIIPTRFDYMFVQQGARITGEARLAA